MEKVLKQLCGQPQAVVDSPGSVEKKPKPMDVALGTGLVVLGDAWSFPVLTIP